MRESRSIVALVVASALVAAATVAHSLGVYWRGTRSPEYRDAVALAGNLVDRCAATLDFDQDTPWPRRSIRPRA